MTETEYFGLTAEDLPFGVEPPEGMPVSAGIVFDYDTIPAALDDMPPGPVLGVLLSAVDVTKVSGHDQIVVLRAHQRMASHYQAATYRDMAAVNTTMLTFDGYPTDPVEAVEMAAAEVRVALGLTRYAADIEMRFAVDLHRRLPGLFDMFASGDLDLRRVKVIERGTMHLSDGAAQAVVADIAQDASQLTTGQLRARIWALCIDSDPDEAKDRFDTAVTNRRVVVEATDSGTANLMAFDVAPDEAAGGLSDALCKWCGLT